MMKILLHIVAKNDNIIKEDKNKYPQVWLDDSIHCNIGMLLLPWIAQRAKTHSGLDGF